MWLWWKTGLNNKRGLTFPKNMVLEESTTQTKCQAYFLSVIKIILCESFQFVKASLKVPSVSADIVNSGWLHSNVKSLQMVQWHITGKLDAHLHCWKGSWILLCIFTDINFRIWRQAAKISDSYQLFYLTFTLLTFSNFILSISTKNLLSLEEILQGSCALSLFLGEGSTDDLAPGK